jgi:hypothetical protein
MLLKTVMRTSGDIIAHGDELTNIGELKDNLDGKNTQPKQRNNTWYTVVSVHLLSL